MGCTCGKVPDRMCSSHSQSNMNSPRNDEDADILEIGDSDSVVVESQRSKSLKNSVVVSRGVDIESRESPAERSIPSNDWKNLEKNFIEIYSCYLKPSIRNSDDELKVILKSSFVGPYTCFPWPEDSTYDVVSKDILSMSVQWVDPEPQFSLSSGQKAKISTWTRLADFYKSSFSVVNSGGPKSSQIRQGFIGDCSFLCSLAVLADFQRHTKQQVLSSIIYPQDSSGWPCLSSSGCYAVKFFFNGSHRRINVDDSVPVKSPEKILCGHSGLKELWVTLLEKAFVKVMGGSLSLPGSNPGTDIFHLTGWIPEAIPFYHEVKTGPPGVFPVKRDFRRISLDVKDPKWTTLFNLMITSFNRRHCVVCLGTSDIKDSTQRHANHKEGVSASSGIVAGHAYALLDVCETDGHKLLRLKNPWGYVRWKGRFSPEDDQSWTLKLQKQLNYDPDAAKKNDNGVFWIGWEDVVRWFSHIYLCWNQKNFKFHQEIHSSWKRHPLSFNSILKDDSCSKEFNSQFLLEVLDDNAAGMVTIWVLFTRHIVDRDTTNSIYVALHLYEDLETKNSFLIPFKQGTYSNGETSLMKIRLNLSTKREGHVILPSLSDVSEVSAATAPISWTSDDIEANDIIGRSVNVVVSQYSQRKDFDFSLLAYSDVSVRISSIPSALPITWNSIVARGNWKGNSCGGSSNELWSFFMNPIFRFELPVASRCFFVLESRSDVTLNLRVFTTPFPTPRELRSGQIMSSGVYRQETTSFFPEGQLAAGVYSLIPSAFKLGAPGDFQITIHTDCPTIFIVPRVSSPTMDHSYNLKTPDLLDDRVASFLKKISISPNNQKGLSVLPEVLRLTPTPNPFAIPVHSNFIQQVVTLEPTDKLFAGVFDLTVQKPTIMGLKLVISAFKSSDVEFNSLPSMAIFSVSKIAESKSASTAQLVLVSDLEGGLNPYSTHSGGAQDYYLKEKSLIISSFIATPQKIYRVCVSFDGFGSQCEGSISHLQTRAKISRVYGSFSLRIAADADDLVVRVPPEAGVGHYSRFRSLKGSEGTRKRKLTKE